MWNCGWLKWLFQYFRYEWEMGLRVGQGRLEETAKEGAHHIPLTTHDHVKTMACNLLQIEEKQWKLWGWSAQAAELWRGSSCKRKPCYICMSSFISNCCVSDVPLRTRWYELNCDVKCFGWRRGLTQHAFIGFGWSWVLYSSALTMNGLKVENLNIWTLQTPKCVFEKEDE